jgi:hypothetical protein
VRLADVLANIYETINPDTNLARNAALLYRFVMESVPCNQAREWAFVTGIFSRRAQSC